MKFLPKLYHTIRSYFTSKVELLQLIKRQLEITDTHFRPMHEDYRSFPNDADLKSKFRIFNMDVNFILSKPMLKLNEIFNQALLKDKKQEIVIHSRARPTIYSLLVLNWFKKILLRLRRIFIISRTQSSSYRSIYFKFKIESVSELHFV